MTPTPPQPPASAPPRLPVSGPIGPHQDPFVTGRFAPQPQQIARHRTAGDVVKGVGAFLVLAVLLGAIPFALIRYIGYPLPHRFSTDLFNHALTSTVLLKALAIIVWLAWAQFAACVVVEFLAAVRGIGMPARVPAAGPSQFLARQLIAALLMITASAASFVPNLAHLGASAPPPAQMPVSHSAAPLPGPHPRAAIAAAAHASSAGYNLPAVRGESGLRVASNTQLPATLGATKLYRVQPPHGRHHDTLWEIAQRHLGDGRRYREVFELNKDRVQPDGSKLTHASLIRPGWILTMPADAVGGDLVVEAPPPATPSAPGTPSAPPQGSPTPGTPGAPTGPEHLSPAPPTGVPHASPSTLGTSPSASPTQDYPTQNPPAASTSPSPAMSTSPSALSPVPPNASVAGNQTTKTQDSTRQSTSTQPAVTSRHAPALAAPSGPAVSDSPRNTSAPADTQPADSAAVPVAGPVAGVTQPFAIAQSADDLTRIASAAAAAAGSTEGEDATPTVTIPVAASAPDAAVPDPSASQASEKPATDVEPAADTSAADAATSTGPSAPSTASDTATVSSAPGTSPEAVAQVLANAPILRARSTPVVARTGPSVTAASALTPVGSNHQGTTTAALAAPRSSHRGTHAPEESQAPSTENRVLYGLAAAPLLAAGLLKALGRHRRRQLWNRIFGRRPVTATGDGAVAEESIRIGAGEVEVWFLDLALRGLSAGLAERGATVPGTYAVRLRDEGIELLLNKAAAPDDPDTVRPPAPWFLAPDGRSWNFPRPGIVDVDAHAAHRRFAPYPGLVTIGGQGPDRVMIDLEEARGLIGLDGPAEARRAVLAALAVELATNSWSDRMTVTLVGFPGDLTPLAPARVRHVRTLDEILPSLEIEAGERTKALAAAGLASVLDGRSRAGQASSFPPHFVLISEQPHAAILARLAAVATTAARIGLGFVVAGEVVGATWQLTVNSELRVAAPMLGIEAQAQLLPEEQYAAVLGLFRSVCDIDGTDLATQPVHQSIGYAGPLPDEPPSVYASLLGSFEVTGVGTSEPERAALLNEALVFLLHHRDGVHPRVLAAALWPRGTTADVAEATFARLATWLGDDPHGQPNLHTDAEGRLKLGPYVWSDWDMFVSLQSRAVYDASIPEQEQRDALLKGALDLVRGPFLADREPNRYGWLAYEIAEAQVPAVIADTALQLADARIAAADGEGAIEAIKAGMHGSPDDEELWRGLLRATAATEDGERLRGAIEGLYKRTWYVHGVQGLHPRTEALVNELMPGWREVLAA